MSKKAFKSQASSGRLPTGGFGAFGGSVFGSSQSSVLSYIQEAPDYSEISDPNVVVAFKNLSKRDATTKAKALEDLLASTSAPEATVEEGFLQAWVRPPSINRHLECLALTPHLRRSYSLAFRLTPRDVYDNYPTI